jgi:hypothetical protein
VAVSALFRSQQGHIFSYCLRNYDVSRNTFRRNAEGPLLVNEILEGVKDRGIVFFWTVTKHRQNPTSVKLVSKPDFKKGRVSFFFIDREVRHYMLYWTSASHVIRYKMGFELRTLYKKPRSFEIFVFFKRRPN